MKDPCCQHRHGRGQQQLHETTEKNNPTDVKKMIERKLKSNGEHQKYHPDLSHHLNVFR